MLLLAVEYRYLGR